MNRRPDTLARLGFPQLWGPFTARVLVGEGASTRGSHGIRDPLRSFAPFAVGIRNLNREGRQGSRRRINLFNLEGAAGVRAGRAQLCDPARRRKRGREGASDTPCGHWWEHRRSGTPAAALDKLPPRNARLAANVRYVVPVPARPWSGACCQGRHPAQQQMRVWQARWKGPTTRLSQLPRLRNYPGNRGWNGHKRSPRSQRR